MSDLIPSPVLLAILQNQKNNAVGGGGNNWQIIMDETLSELALEVSFQVPNDTKEMICFFKSGSAPASSTAYLRSNISGLNSDEVYASFGGSLSNNSISIGCQKIQLLNSQYGLVEYSFLYNKELSKTSWAQRLGKPSLLRIDTKSFSFNASNTQSGYPVGTRLLVFVRR